jgi:hypothetical protein
MHRILFLPDIQLIRKPETGYPVRAGNRISGKGRIPDIRPDTWLDNYIFGKISNKFMKTALPIIDFCKHCIKNDLVTMCIFMQILFLALFEEKLNKLLVQLNISRISGIRPYRISGSSIWYLAGYRISKKAGYRISKKAGLSGASLLWSTLSFCIPVQDLHLYK